MIRIVSVRMYRLFWLQTISMNEKYDQENSGNFLVRRATARKTNKICREKLKFQLAVQKKKNTSIKNNKRNINTRIE